MTKTQVIFHWTTGQLVTEFSSLDFAISYASGWFGAEHSGPTYTHVEVVSDGQVVRTFSNPDRSMFVMVSA